MGDLQNAPREQLVGLCTMLAILERHLPDDVLAAAVFAVGGPVVFADALVRVHLGQPGEDTALLESAHRSVARVRAYVAQGVHGCPPP